MAVKPPFTEVDINTQDSGFYEGYSLPIALISKISMVVLVLWALIWPLGAGSALSSWNSSLLNGFNSFYVISTGLFAFFLFAVALIPSTGKRVLGQPGDTPEFSNFSWFAMMFGAGLGVGLMTFATAEPVGLWGSNPLIVDQTVAPNTPEALQGAYRYTFAHYGFHAWAIYVVTGLSLAYYAYTRGMPLTIRTALTPLIGKWANSPLGHLIDVLGVVATILGVSVTIGFGVAQFVDGVYSVTGMEWLQDTTGDAPAPSTVGLLVALVIIMTLSIISAVSGVGRGVKYLSNLNLVLSVILLLTFVIFGSFMFAMTTYATALADYILNFVSLSFGAYTPQSASDFAAALPADAAPFVDILSGGAQNTWGSFAGFTGGLDSSAQATAAAAAMGEDTLGAVYGATDVLRSGGELDMAAFTALLPEAAAPIAGELSTLAGGAASATELQTTLAGLSEARSGAAALPAETLSAAYTAGTEARLFGWQAGWTTFYWAWWIAFSPFVGLFLARISRGRTVREFVLGAVIAPSLVCWAWMTILGGTAIDLELSGVADGAIIAASNSAKLFVTMEAMLPDTLYSALVIMCVVLIMTFLVTSADSGILVMNTIMSGGAEDTGVFHRIIWGVIMTLLIGTLLVAGGGGLSALQNAMIIGALPFCMIMVAMMLSLIKAMWNDSRRDRANAPASAAAQPAE